MNYTPKQAPTEQVDADLTEAALRERAICVAMAAATVAERDAMLPELVETVIRISRLRFERDQIIRKTFYR